LGRGEAEARTHAELYSDIGRGIEATAGVANRWQTAGLKRERVSGDGAKAPGRWASGVTFNHPRFEKE
jgi:hypothetical protein